MQGALLDGTLMQWKWTGEEIVIPVGNSGIWPIIAEIRVREEGWQKRGDWNIEEGKSKELMNTWTI